MEPCYLCRSSNTELAFEKNGYQYSKCLNCGLYALLLNEPYPKFLKRYYDEGYFRGNPNRCAYVDYQGDEKIIKKNMRVYLDEILNFKKEGKLLDIGCSLGFFLELAEEAGFEPFGIDISSYAFSEAKKRGVTNIKLGELSQVGFSKKSFDVICLFDVIEHFQDPRAQLNQANKLLKDDGILIIETGKLESFFARLLGKHWYFFAPPQHLFIFGLSQLKTLLSQCDLQVVRSTTTNKWASLRYLTHLAASIGRVPLTHKLSHLLKKNHLGTCPIYLPLNDKVLVIATKN
jgi:2-polyprenyl-3-methyl-5-hydroxy-6-metoxy-1,4-benzoquinol methylase